MNRCEIYINDMGGWVRVYLGRGEPAGETAGYLSDSLTHWFRDRPNLRMLCIVPVSRDGDTAELHAWYEDRVPPVTADQQPQ